MTQTLTMAKAMVQDPRVESDDEEVDVKEDKKVRAPKKKEHAVVPVAKEPEKPEKIAKQEESEPKDFKTAMIEHMKIKFEKAKQDMEECEQKMGKAREELAVWNQRMLEAQGMIKALQDLYKFADAI